MKIGPNTTWNVSECYDGDCQDYLSDAGKAMHNRHTYYYYQENRGFEVMRRSLQLQERIRD